jgi:hypothetical protein
MTVDVAAAGWNLMETDLAEVDKNSLARLEHLRRFAFQHDNTI